MIDRSMRGFKLVMLVAGFFNLFVLNGQVPSLKFDNYSTLEGLSSSVAIEILEDSEGYLWIGTHDGLNKFDGYGFEIYRNINGDTTSLSNNRITSLIEDHVGRLWVGTNNGLNFLAKGKNTFRRVDFNLQDNSAQNHIRALAFDPKTRWLWVGTEEGLIRFDFDSLGNTVKQLRFTDSTNKIDGSEIDDIVISEKGDVWMVTGRGILHHYLQAEQKFETFQLPEKTSTEINQWPFHLIETIDGEILIGNDLEHLMKFDPSSRSFTVLNLQLGNTVAVSHMLCDTRGNIWLSSDGYGLFVLDSELRLRDHITHDPKKPSSLPNNQPAFTYEDSNEIFWIGTYNKGFCKLSAARSAFVHLTHSREEPNGLSGPIAQAVVVDKKDRVWIGIDGGGLTLYDEHENTFRHFRSDDDNPHTISSDKIVYLCEGKEGGIWACTWDKGINRFDPKTEKAVRYLKEEANQHSISENTIICAAPDRSKGLWVGTFESGINYFDPGKNKFFRFTNQLIERAGLPNSRVQHLFIDKQNRLLVGSTSGLAVVDLNRFDYENPEELPFIPFDKVPFQGMRITHITQGPDGDIWVGSNTGLHRVDEDFSKITSYNVLSGLANNLVVGVTVELDGTVWFTSKGGLSRLNPEKGRIINFSEQDGIQGAEFQSKSIFQKHDGRIFIGGINGLNIFHPDDVVLNHVAVDPMITGLRVLNTEIGVGDTLIDRVLLEKPLNQTEGINLKYNEGFLTIDFVALHYLSQEHVKYAHRMLGVSDDWVYVENENRSATFSNLTSGDYRFEVMATLDDNWDNSSVAALDIHVATPPWRTVYAYLVYCLVVALITWIILRYYSRTMREIRRRELDHNKMEFFMNVSHEFRTPLALILNPVDKLLAELDPNEKPYESALTIQRSSMKLVNLVNQLLDFRKVDLGKSPLDPVKADVVRSVKDSYSMFEDLAKLKGLEMHFETELASTDMWFDPDKLEKIVSNLLSNAIKFTDPGGKIIVRILQEKGKSKAKRLLGKSDPKDFVIIEVEDTGIGLKKEELALVFDRFFHISSTNTGTGIGLNYTKSLVQQHDGEISVISEFGKGSKFVVRLPLVTERASSAWGNHSKHRSKHLASNDSLKSLEYTLVTSDLVPTKSEEAEAEHKSAKTGENQTILIVEDNKELRVHLRKGFEDKFRVKEANNGKVGLQKAIKFCPDVIISDVVMPEMDGFEMCRELKQNDQTVSIPVILLTARSYEEDKIEGYELGADSYLAKPFSMQVLQARVHNLMETRKQLRNRFASVASLSPASDFTSNSLDERLVDSAIKIVTENISNSDFGLEELVTELGISRSYFYRRISSITGQKPSAFIRTIRLKYAADLLKQNAYSIKEIAYKTGFNSSAYFSKTFREHFNKTPREFIDAAEE
ncbi:hybrid sensor histidine kinase/response regulator transcription factor [Marinoscillum furvescens]|uniref:histidine kinase n=1 Tax=Marinoscillum furvescens DSM 4134 TaxID=1122208 RepID=A0A3D9L1L4_MARFU|nr:two-component regulator propeller domain-containing protein [Marinoscillum furvescens]RED95976.1 signal transduction histidine kinase [Marinoscillum furvescens DSM 4134]